MKEKDFEKCLDNLIIDGLIKESEQDNAEFEAALRSMSDEDFLQLISQDLPVEVADSYHLGAAEPSYNELIFEDEEFKVSHSPINLNRAQRIQCSTPFIQDGFDETSYRRSKSKPANWKLWVGAIASVAAILLIVLIPTIHNTDSKLCQSALIASSSFYLPSRGFEVASLPSEEIKAMLPELQKQYEASMHQDKISLEAIESNKEFSEEYYFSSADPQEAGMDLVQAYLKLNEKDKAIDVLRQLSDEYGDSDFGEHCRKLLEILE